MDVGIKERMRFRDISWMMPGVDVESAMAKLGTQVSGRSGDRMVGFCHDHHLFTGRRPSHPRWLVNTVTGDTYCLTEGRGSNLVWTFCRMFGCSPSEAAKVILGEDKESLTAERIAQMALKGKMRRLREVRAESAPRSVFGIDDIMADLKDRPASGRLYDFFIHPPGKMHPTNIRRETVDRYEVFERTWGRYSDRAMVPVRMRGELRGFVAIDLLGQEAWQRKHPLCDSYKKTLTADNMKINECLFGFDDCRKGADYLVVAEGPREVMKLWQEGFPDAVATFGISVSPAHLVLISELCPKCVLLMYDRDPRGVEAMERQARKLEKNFRTGRCFVPVGRDPKNLCAEEIGAVINLALQVVKSREEGVYSRIQ